MTRTIKVCTLSLNGTEIKEVTLEEAERILEETYNDELGGLVADGKTREIIWTIGPHVDEIIVIPVLLGGG